MNRIIAIFAAVTRNWLRSRSGLFFSILFPLMLLLVFGAVFGVGGSGTYNIQIQNKDLRSDGSPTPISSAFIQALNQTKALAISPIPASANPTSYAKSTGGAGFFGGKQRVLIIPHGFEDGLLNGTAKERLTVTSSTLASLLQHFGQNISQEQKQGIQQGLGSLNRTLSQLQPSNATLLYLSQPDDVGGQVVKGIISSAANSFNYGLVGAHPIITFSNEVIAARGLHPVDYYLPGITAAFIMTNGVIGLTSVATEFKRSGVLKRLSATPLTRFDWIMGNVLSQAILAVALTAIMILAGYTVFGVSVTIDAYAVALIIVGAILFAGIGMLLAGLVKDPEAASGLGNAIAFPMMFLSGVYIPLDAAPRYVQTISTALPLTYFSDGLRAALVLQDSRVAGFDLLVIGLLAAIFIAVGSLVTRWKEG